MKQFNFTLGFCNSSQWPALDNFIITAIIKEKLQAL